MITRYNPIDSSYGVASVLWVQTIISIVAALLSSKFIDKDETFGVEPVDEETEPLDPASTSPARSPKSNSVNADYGTSPLTEPLTSTV